MVRKSSNPQERHYEKHGTAIKPLPKKGGAGKGGWGNVDEEIKQAEIDVQHEISANEVNHTH